MASPGALGLGQVPQDWCSPGAPGPSACTRKGRGRRGRREGKGKEGEEMDASSGAPGPS